MAVIDRRQAETMAWHYFVGSQSPKEFVESAQAEGMTIEEAVEDYVKQIPNMFDLEVKEEDPLFEGNTEPPVWTFGDLPRLLQGYIERQLEG